MRHRIRQRKLNRTSEHRKALHRNLAMNLFERGMVRTTLPKARDLRPFCERLITLAVKVRKYRAAGEKSRALTVRRSIHKLLGDRSLIPSEHQEAYDDMSDAMRARTMRMASGRRHRTGDPKGRLAFTAESVTHRLIEKVAPRFEDRPGGYTRLIRLADRRVGDATPLAIIQFVGDEEEPGPVTKPGKTARRKRADARYAMAVKLAKSRGGSTKAGKPEADEKPVATEPESVEDEAPSDDAPAADSEPEGDDKTQPES